MKLTSPEIYARLERMRALAVIEKAQREETNVVDSLVMHMVPLSLILELTGEEPDRSSKRSRNNSGAKLHAWAVENIGREVKKIDVADGLSVSESTAYKVIRDNIDYFSPIKRGLYLVRDGKAERKAAKSTGK
jgi:hypothetical protein